MNLLFNLLSERLSRINAQVQSGQLGPDPLVECLQLSLEYLRVLGLRIPIDILQHRNELRPTGKPAAAHLFAQDLDFILMLRQRLSDRRELVLKLKSLVLKSPCDFIDCFLEGLVICFGGLGEPSSRTHIIQLELG